MLPPRTIHNLPVTSASSSAKINVSIASRQSVKVWRGGKRMMTIPE